MRRIQLLHGTKAVNDAFIGRKGELTCDTDDYSLRVHDGETAGGHQIGVRIDFILDAIYPVGSIYLSVNNLSPSSFLGGVWERIGEGKALIGASSYYIAGNSYGSNTHRLTENEMPSHNHVASTDSQGSHHHGIGTQNISGSFASISNGSYGGKKPYANGAFSITTPAPDGKYDGNHGSANYAGKAVTMNAKNSWTGDMSDAGAHSHTVTVNSSGGGEAFSVMQESLAVYMWKRTN